MKIAEIVALPVIIKDIPTGARGVHESVLRSYQILVRVKYWLGGGVPAKVILELISEMEAIPPHMAEQLANAASEGEG